MLTMYPQYVYVNRCMIGIVNLWTYLVKINPKKCFKCIDFKILLFSLCICEVLIWIELSRNFWHFDAYVYIIWTYTSVKLLLRYANVTQWAARYVTDGKCVDSWNNKTLSCKVLSKRLMYWSNGIAVFTYHTSRFVFFRNRLTFQLLGFKIIAV